MARIRILIADDHAVVREGLERMLADQPDFWVVGTAPDGEAALREAERCEPHVILMDMRMPVLGGVAAIRRLREQCPQSHVLVLSMYEDPDYVRAALAAGAHGYLGKRTGANVLAATIRRLHAGQPVAEEVSSGVEPQRDVNTLGLSAREREIARLVIKGQTSRQIADTLGISKSSVDTYRSRVFRKLRVDNRAALVDVASQLDPGEQTEETEQPRKLRRDAE